MTILARLAWIIGGSLTSAGSAAFMAWWMLSTALTGFTTSQQTLSDHMNALQGSLDQSKQISDGQIATARGDLSKEIAGLADTMKEFNVTLTKSLTENSSQLATLNANLAGVDKRLTDSITRQQAFETLVLQRIVYQGPLQSDKTAGVAQMWIAAGYEGQLVRTINDTLILNQWESLTTVLQK